LNLRRFFSTKTYTIKMSLHVFNFYCKLYCIQDQRKEVLIYVVWIMWTSQMLPSLKHSGWNISAIGAILYTVNRSLEVKHNQGCIGSYMYMYSNRNKKKQKKMRFATLVRQTYGQCFAPYMLDGSPYVYVLWNDKFKQTLSQIKHIIRFVTFNTMQ